MQKREQLVAAYKQLIAENRKVTVRSMRSVMGGGNLERIRSFLAELRGEEKLVKELGVICRDLEKHSHEIKKGFDNAMLRSEQLNIELREKFSNLEDVFANLLNGKLSSDANEIFEMKLKLQSLLLQNKKLQDENSKLNFELNRLRQRVEN